jgi:hypothetical protein
MLSCLVVFEFSSIACFGIYSFERYHVHSISVTYEFIFLVRFYITYTQKHPQHALYKSPVLFEISLPFSV